MKRFDIVRPTPGYALVSGSTEYLAAIVLSVDPFVITSMHTDMTWAKADPNDFISLGKADPEFLKRVKEGLLVGKFTRYGL
jgi:hypothetical protein